MTNTANTQHPTNAKEDSAMKLRFRRTTTAYFAEDDTRQYSILKEGKARWVLRVRELVETVGIKHAVGQPVLDSIASETLREAKEVAQEYHDLGDDYLGHLHRRMYQASINVSDRRSAALRDELQRLRDYLKG